MHITVIRSGGFAGVTRTYAISPADLSPEDAAAVFRLVHRVRAKHRPNAVAPIADTSDAFQYDLEIDEAGTVQRFPSVELHDPSPALELARTVIAHTAH